MIQPMATPKPSAHAARPPAPVETPAKPVFILNSHNRCDACGARAYHRVTLDDAHQFEFCAHHGAQHRAKLEPKAAHWLDESAQLTIDASAHLTDV